jgi:hypothetical protein
MPVEIHNLGDGPASYEVDIRVTGPNGFDALVATTNGVREPGRRASQALTITDRSGTAIPDEPVVTVQRALRTPF